jgi:uncharacterized DUF497 family protein
MGIEFDPAKRIINLRQHKIDLADVEGVFYDPMAITIEDRDHNEQRFVVIGTDWFGRVLVVCYTWRDDATIRVISARKAELHERKQYEG